jgi:hypothetical protein
MADHEDFVVVIIDNMMALDNKGDKNYAISAWVTQSAQNQESQVRVNAKKTRLKNSRGTSQDCYTAKITMPVPKKTAIDDRNEHLLWIHFEEDQSTTSYGALDKANLQSLKADFPSTRFKRKSPYPIEGGIGYIPLADILASSYGGCILYDRKFTGGDSPVEKACVFVARKNAIGNINPDVGLKVRARTWMTETQSGDDRLQKFLGKYVSHFMRPYVYDSKTNSVTLCRTVGGAETAGLIFPMAPFTIGRALRDTYVMEDVQELTMKEKEVGVPRILHNYLEVSASKRGKNISDLAQWVADVTSKGKLSDKDKVELQQWNQIITGAATDAATSIRYTADVSSVRIKEKNVRVSTESWDSLLAGSLGDDCEGLACFTVGLINTFRYLNWEDLCKDDAGTLSTFQAVRFVRSFFACFMVVGTVSGAYVPREGGGFPTIGSSEDMAHQGGHGWAMDAPIAKLVTMLETCMGKRNESSDDHPEFKDAVHGYISGTHKTSKGLIDEYLSKVRPDFPMNINDEKDMGVFLLEGTGPVVADIELKSLLREHYDFMEKLKANPNVDVLPRLPPTNRPKGARWTDFYKIMVDIMGRDLHTFFGGYSARTLTYSGGNCYIGAHMEHFIQNAGTGFFINQVYTADSIKENEEYKSYIKYIIANRPKQGIAESVYMDKHRPLRTHIDFESVDAFLSLYKTVALDYLSRKHVNFLKLFCEAADTMSPGTNLKPGETTFSVTKRPSLFFLDREVAKDEGHKRYVKRLTASLAEEMKGHMNGIGYRRQDDPSVPNVTRIKVMVIRHSPTTESRIEIMYCAGPTSGIEAALPRPE